MSYLKNLFNLTKEDQKASIAECFNVSTEPERQSPPLPLRGVALLVLADGGTRASFPSRGRRRRLMPAWLSSPAKSETAA
jgi:hypothetical protein